MQLALIQQGHGPDGTSTAAGVPNAPPSLVGSSSAASTPTGGPSGGMGGVGPGSIGVQRPTQSGATISGPGGFFSEISAGTLLPRTEDVEMHAKVL